jgi:hypothetical protein
LFPSFSIEWYIWFIKVVRSLLLTGWLWSMILDYLIFRMRWNRWRSESYYIRWDISIALFVILQGLTLVLELHAHSMRIEWIACRGLIIGNRRFIHDLWFLTREIILDAWIYFNIWSTSFHYIASVVLRLTWVIASKRQLIFTFKDSLISPYSRLLRFNILNYLLIATWEAWNTTCINKLSLRTSPTCLGLITLDVRNIQVLFEYYITKIVRLEHFSIISLLTTCIDWFIFILKSIRLKHDFYYSFLRRSIITHHFLGKSLRLRLFFSSSNEVITCIVSFILGIH